MIEEQIWITNRFGEKLEALIRKPDGDGPFPAVVFVSGFGMDLHEWKNSNDEISKRLVEQGFLTLQFSFAGRGKSEGDYLDMTLNRQAVQVEDVIAWVVKRDEVDIDNIGIYTTSFGCPTIMSSHLESVSSLCLVSGVYFLAYLPQRKAVAKNGITLFYDPFEGDIPVGPDFWKGIHVFEPIGKAVNIQQPVCLIHSTNDPYITVDNAQKVYAAFPNKNKKLKFFLNAGHSITDVPRPMREKFLHDVVEWFRETL